MKTQILISIGFGLAGLGLVWYLNKQKTASLPDSLEQGMQDVNNAFPSQIASGGNGYAGTPSYTGTSADQSSYNRTGGAMTNKLPTLAVDPFELPLNGTDLIAYNPIYDRAGNVVGTG